MPLLPQRRQVSLQLALLVCCGAMSSIWSFAVYRALWVSMSAAGDVPPEIRLTLHTVRAYGP